MTEKYLNLVYFDEGEEFKQVIHNITKRFGEDRVHQVPYTVSKALEVDFGSEFRDGDIALVINTKQANNNQFSPQDHSNLIPYLEDLNKGIHLSSHFLGFIPYIIIALHQPSKQMDSEYLYEPKLGKMLGRDPTAALYLLSGRLFSLFDYPNRGQLVEIDQLFRYPNNLE